MDLECVSCKLMQSYMTKCAVSLSLEYECFVRFVINNLMLCPVN